MDKTINETKTANRLMGKLQALSVEIGGMIDDILEGREKQEPTLKKASEKLDVFYSLVWDLYEVKK